MVRKTKEEAQETRNALLDAAENVFQEHGVSHTSLAEIATAAGVTRGAVYWHFKDKADLVEAMFQRAFDPFEADFVAMQTNVEGNPIDGMKAVTRHFFDRLVGDPRFFRILDISWLKCEYVGEMAAIRDSHLECGNRYLVAHEGAFQRAKERGYLPSSVDPRCAAVGLMALADGLIVNWVLDRELFPLASYGPIVVDAYLDGLCVVKMP